MKVTLRQLDAFVAVANTRSFSQAAQSLHVTQPALTSMIQKLEAQLGVVLFARTRRGAELTTTARELLPDLQRTMGNLEAVISDIQGFTAPRGGTVTLASIPSLSTLIIPQLIARFEDAYPRIKVTLKDAMTENRSIHEMLRTGDIDYGIGSPSGEQDGLEFDLFMHDELVALVPDGHTMAARKTLRWTELAPFPLIGMSYQSNVRMLVDEAFAANGISKRPKREVSLISTAVGMVRAGLGVTVLPTTAIEVCNITGLKVLRLRSPRMLRPLGFLHQPTRNLSPAANVLLRFVKEQWLASA
jgi:LysR family carnitine catabolism transcriptional activator